MNKEKVFNMILELQAELMSYEANGIIKKEGAKELRKQIFDILSELDKDLEITKSKVKNKDRNNELEKLHLNSMYGKFGVKNE